MSNKSLLIVASLAYDGIETSEHKIERTLGGACLLYTSDAADES